MTYQYLTVEMVYKANSSRDFIVQKKFKTTANYLFDSLLFDQASMDLSFDERLYY